MFNWRDFDFISCILHCEDVVWLIVTFVIQGGCTHPLSTSHYYLSKLKYPCSSKVSLIMKLTDLAMAGSPHSVLSSLVLCNRPSVSTFLSRTSTPNTPGFIGLGYFCIAALVTVSHGWLLQTIITSETATS